MTNCCGVSPLRFPESPAPPASEPPELEEPPLEELPPELEEPLLEELPPELDEPLLEELPLELDEPLLEELLPDPEELERPEELPAGAELSAPPSVVRASPPEELEPHAVAPSEAQINAHDSLRMIPAGCATKALVVKADHDRRLKLRDMRSTMQARCCRGHAAGREVQPVLQEDALAEGVARGIPHVAARSRSLQKRERLSCC